MRLGPRASEAAAAGHLTRWFRANPGTTRQRAHATAREIALFVQSPKKAEELLPGLETQVEHYFTAWQR